MHNDEMPEPGEASFLDEEVMPPGSLYSARYPMAMAYAATQHAAQRRKDEAGSPYIGHPVAVSLLVWQHGAGESDLEGELEDLAIAALLHDIAEDTGGRAALAQLRAMFGDRVAQVVTAATDAMPEPGEDKPAWRPRKEAHIARVHRLASGDAESGLAADRGACLVIAADKFHNLADTAQQVGTQGDAFLERFRGGPEGTRWYYTSMREALAPAIPGSLLDQIDESLALLGA